MMLLTAEPDCTRSRSFLPTGSLLKCPRPSVRFSDSVGFPSMASILSPALIPALSAGLPETTSTTLNRNLLFGHRFQEIVSLLRQTARPKERCRRKCQRLRPKRLRICCRLRLPRFIESPPSDFLRHLS